jgi:hypothetical protein
MAFLMGSELGRNGEPAPWRLVEREEGVTRAAPARQHCKQAP